MVQWKKEPLRISRMSCLWGRQMTIDVRRIRNTGCTFFVNYSFSCQCSLPSSGHKSNTAACRLQGLKLLNSPPQKNKKNKKSVSIETLLWSMFSSLSIFSTCETTLSRPGAQTHSAPALPPCIVVLSCLNKWPVRWWMLLSFLHSAAVLAGEGINEKPPKTVRLFISLPHLTHTHTHQPPQHENPNATSFIIQSVCGKTRREAEVLFFPPLIYMNGQVGVVCSVMYSVLWVWNDPGLNTKMEKMTFIKQR